MDFPVDQWAETLTGAVTEIMQFALTGQQIPMEKFTVEFEVPAPLARVITEIAEDTDTTKEEILGKMASAGLRESIESFTKPGTDRIHEAQQDKEELSQEMKDIQSKFGELQQMMDMVPKFQEAVSALQGLNIPDGSTDKNNT